MGLGLGAREAASGGIEERTFEAVWSSVAESYYDASFGGLDWDAVGREYRERLKAAQNRSELRKLLNEMLRELGESHIGILSGAYDELAEEPVWLGGDARVDLCYAGPELVFYRVDADGAGYQAGIRAGDRIESLDGVSVAEMLESVQASGLPEYLWRYTALQRALFRFRARPGDEVSVMAVDPQGRRKACQVRLEPYEGPFTERFGNFGEIPYSFSFETRSDGISVMRFSLWFPAVMAEVRRALREMPESARGLVIDLRGNPGGVGFMATGLAGMLVDQRVNLGTTRMREGHLNFQAYPQPNAYLGPVAVLVDEGSCSTSEIFAAGLQEAGRARVFGHATPGAALPSVVMRLPNGDFLQMATGDFETPGGRSLEGVGVAPDEFVSISPVDLSKGNDTVLHAALGWISQLNPETYEN
ncbi:S41 family peptidase [Pelagicoccus sp. SDUM812003]|uniref:S41 family peptidase n=1 Tax=Pelagicoccus sp. SDUM812003 TaxID=3041267 RepID=UPI00280EF03C|nr:S41 family peptidase [Pelagicoccus sp. SDUM812003]MDQ8205611.1 S41 family peptidase [Pelagicoccus sp. SDUM812003]